MEERLTFSRIITFHLVECSSYLSNKYSRIRSQKGTHQLGVSQGILGSRKYSGCGYISNFCYNTQHLEFYSKLSAGYSIDFAQWKHRIHVSSIVMRRHHKVILFRIKIEYTPKVAQKCIRMFLFCVSKCSMLCDFRYNVAHPV